ncbi:ABC transporter permease, partial [Myxococcota bacterium]|nr:ABC transporter permease [Myxococcota bacterium]
MQSADGQNPSSPGSTSPKRSSEVTARVARLSLAPFSSLAESRQIVYFLARKRIVARYRGSILGIVWSFVLPALMLTIYTLVFGVVLQSRWSAGESTTTEYAFLLYLGLCVYWLVSECVSEAPLLIQNHANYVKKVVFPLEILPWVSLADALFHSAIRIAVFVIALTLFQGPPPATILLLPFIWLPLCLWTLGLCWILAAAGAFLRDLHEVMGLILVALL